MIHSKKPVQVSIGISGMGVAAHLLTTFLLFVLPQYFMSPATAHEFLNTWFHSISTVGGLLTVYGTPLLAGIAGFYLITSGKGSLEYVLVGIILGGVVYGAGVALVDWAVTHPQLQQSSAEYGGRALEHAARLVGTASFGTLIGMVVSTQNHE